MIKENRILKILLILALLIAIINIPTVIKAEYTADKEWSTIKPGDVIYFDMEGLDWDTVNIYIWENGTNNYYKPWVGETMDKVEGTNNIYSFTAPADMESNKYNMVIFNNGNGNQTIDLGFIEAGFVYKVNGEENGKKTGYWYLYDKSSIVSHLENIKKYQADKQYYTEDSYGNLDELITKAVTELNEEIRLEMERDDNGIHTGMYYIQIDYTIDEIETVINNLIVDKTILQEKVSSEEESMEKYTKTYTPDSLKDLTNELEKANELLTKTTITVDEVKQAISDIETAERKLVSKADKTTLEELLKQVEELDKTIYTDESVNNLTEVAEASKVVFNNDNATEQEVNDSIQKLQASINTLEKKPETNNEVENNQDEEGKQEENNNNQSEENKQESQNVEEVVNTPKTGDMAVIICGSLLAIAVITFVATIRFNNKKGKHK